MAKIFDSVGLSNMSNEEIVLAINELNEEKQRREKQKKYQIALNLRNALREFLDNGVECDFSRIYCMSGNELLGIACDCEIEDLDYVEFDPFDTGILREILNELTRSLGELGE